MEEFERKFGEEFFIIDSENLDNVSEKFYGYMVHDNEIIQNDNVYEDIELSGIGSYLWIKNSEDKIKIIQDFAGTYQIFMFISDDKSHFILSNSYIKLAEYLKDKINFSLNEEYANSFLFIDLTSYFYGDTLLNEITVIPRDYEIVIDKINKTIDFNKISFNEHSISLDSQIGMNTLDNWFKKWVGIVRHIRQKSNDIRFDLSGGFDSRMVSAIWFSANMNPNKTFIYSLKNNSKRFIDDYNIASQIADEMGYELNKNVIGSNKKFFKNINIPILFSFYSKLGFHKEMYFPFFRYSQPVYLMGGASGETIRGYYNKTPDEFIDRKVNFLRKKGTEVCDSTKNRLLDSFDKLIKEFPLLDWDSCELPEKLYAEVRNRFHFGKKCVEDYNKNVFNLAPLMDPTLHQLKLNTDDCDDDDLLLAIIFTRFCPKLLNFNFEGNRHIREETLEYAKKINNKYPYIKEQYDYIEGPELKNSSNSIPYFEKEDYLNYLRQIFNSISFKKEFEKFYPSQFYETIFNEINDNGMPKWENLFSAIAILNSINYTQPNSLDLNSWLNMFFRKPLIEENPEMGIFNEEDLKIYETARIDIIKKNGAINEIKILENSDSFSTVGYPKIFQKENSSGFLLTTRKSGINLKLQCIGDGKLSIFLKSQGITDKKGTRFPIYIDYEKVVIDGKNYLDENKLLCHDDRYFIEIDVHDEQIIQLHFEWSPFSKSSIYIDRKNEKLKKQIIKLEKENMKLTEMLNSISNQKS